MREAGDHEEARRILRDIDRGGGLRTVLRAAAALEACDETELADLLPVIAREEPRWRLLLQTAAALHDMHDMAEAQRFLDQGERLGAPAWAMAWTHALSHDEATRRRGLVELLFSDVALARTVAARDLAICDVVADPAAAQRYASFAHGRDSIRRFGARTVFNVIERATATRGLLADDRQGLAQILGLGSELSERLLRGTRAVDWFLRDESQTDAAPLFASLRRITKNKALRRVARRSCHCDFAR
jgi:hypothetical protein